MRRCVYCLEPVTGSYPGALHIATHVVYPRQAVYLDYARVDGGYNRSAVAATLSPLCVDGFADSCPTYVGKSYMRTYSTPT